VDAGARHGAAGGVRPLWLRSAHFYRLATLAITGLIVAVITRRPEFAGVAAPAVLLLAVRTGQRPEEITVSARLTATAVTEGEEASLNITVTGCDDHFVDLVMEPRFAVVPHSAGLRAGASSLPFHVSRSGRRSLGALDVRLWDRLRLTEGRATVNLPRIDCYPRAASLGSRVVLSHLPNRLGEHASRAPGEGMEFTGIREFVPGDRQRRINWPATTRRGQLQLNTFAVQRTQSVVIIADLSADVGEPGSTPADLALRGAAAAAETYLKIRDRVGFVRYQGGVNWMPPGTGTRHHYRILHMMLADQRTFSLPARESVITRLPKAALPPGSLVLVFSPLLDRRLVESVRNLRERGFAILIIDVLNAEPGEGGRIGALARRIWRMEQEAIRFSLRELGIPLVRWDGLQSLDEPLAPYTRRVMVTRR
jgi:uncharacterized protein (DUF58 family)